MNKDSVLHQALTSAMLDEFADIPDTADLGITFSGKFNTQKDRLIRAVGRGYGIGLRKSLRRTILVAAILAALVAAAVAVYAIREAGLFFFVRDSGTHFEFEFDKEQAANAPEHIEEVYRPTYIPDGFVRIDEAVSFASVGFVWYNAESDQYFSYGQHPVTTIGSSGPNAEGVTTKYQIFGDIEVFCVYDRGAIMYFWTDHGYYQDLVFDPGISEEEARKIFFSVSKVEDSRIP